MKLRTINNIIVSLIIIVNGYIMAGPLLPRLTFWWQGRYSNRAVALTGAIHASTSNQAVESPESVVNRVTIPKMLLDQPIVEGPVTEPYNNLKKGIWRWPEGSRPDEGGNTILLGHRFAYTQPQGSLYFLNKLVVGDAIGLTWAGKKYLYIVKETKVVPPTDVSILKPTGTDQLTIYTCAPLWKPVNRLVVIAERRAL